MAKINKNYYEVEMKDYYNIGELEKLTVKQLRSVIWARTKEVNARYATSNSAQAKSMYNMLLGVSGQKFKDGAKVSETKLAANVGMKSKRELIYQAQRLQEFINYDQESDVYQHEFDDKLEQQYQSFLKNHTNVSRQEYIDYVQAAGALGADIEQIDSDLIVQAVKASYEKGKKVNVISLLTQAKKIIINNGDVLDTDNYMKEFADLFNSL